MGEKEEIINAYEDALKEAQIQNNNPNGYQQMQYQEQKQNLIEFELDFSPELIEIARSLRCDILKMDDKGNESWQRNPNKGQIFLNELGVNDVLRKIYLLVNKNKVLSNYNIEEINFRVRMIGHEIRCLIYNNYERYEIDNSYKMNNFSSIVLDVLSIIEDAYRRALGGETHKGLAEQRLVSQSQNISPMQNIQPQMNKNKSSVQWYNPLSWSN